MILKKKTIFVILILSIIYFIMTRQIDEKIVYAGQEWSLKSKPLTDYLAMKEMAFKHCFTFCWRGYVGSWEIRNNCLYLTHLVVHGNYLNSDNHTQINTVGMAELFPNQEFVLADWYTGILRLQFGEEVYRNTLFSLYERELFIKIVSGCVVDQKILEEAYLYWKESNLEEKIFDGQLKQDSTSMMSRRSHYRRLKEQGFRLLFEE